MNTFERTSNSCAACGQYINAYCDECEEKLGTRSAPRVGRGVSMRPMVRPFRCDECEIVFFAPVRSGIASCEQLVFCPHCREEVEPMIHATMGTEYRPRVIA